MSLPIKNTPVLEDNDAILFLKKVYINPVEKVSTEELERIERNFKYIFSIYKDG